jgi:hypothetical protein
MEIAVHSICWNEEKIIPFYLRNYEPIVKKIVIYDNQSSDSSVNLLKKSSKVDIRTYDSDNQIRDDLYLQIKNNVWKENRDYDWVIVCDMDELLYHHNIMDFLETCKKKGITIPHPKSYHLTHSKFPTTNKHIIEEVRKGIPAASEFGKAIIFDPKKIDEINYGFGCHVHFATGIVKQVYFQDLLLLHAKFLGKEYYVNRVLDYGKRMSEFNKKRGFGDHYLASKEGLEESYDVHTANSVSMTIKKNII